MTCEEIGRQLLLLVYGEIDAAGRNAIEGHLAACPGCRIALAEERRLHAVLAARPTPEPGDDLLSECRDALMAALRGEAEGAAVRRAAPPPAWSAWWPRARPSPALAAAFVAVGFLSGWFAMGRGLLPGPRPDAPPGAVAHLTTDLQSFEVDPAGERVSLTYDARGRGSLRGRVDDPAIRRLLLDTVRDGDNAGLRLDAIGLLEEQVADDEVRGALIGTLRDDRNAGARLRALAALDGQSADPLVRDAMTEALLRDENLGVRVRAINALGRTGDPRLGPLMRRLSRDDAEPYIRFRSGAIADRMRAGADR
jgi:hypothetical protein